MARLVESLRATADYPNYKPMVQELFTEMAENFDDDPELLMMSPSELSQRFLGTTQEQWRSFLQLPVVDRYIKNIIKIESQIAFRKAQKALSIEAAAGNTSAAKQITEISGVLQQEQTNRIVILTYVPRRAPNIVTPTASGSGSGPVAAQIEEEKGGVIDVYDDE